MARSPRFTIRPATGPSRLPAIAALALALAGACRSQAPGSAPRPAPSSRSAADPAPIGRLGDAVRPRRAALELAIDPREPRFDGRVVLDLDLIRPTAAIWLHARALELGRARLQFGGRVIDLEWLPAPGSEVIGLGLGEKLGPGPARLVIDYRGRLGNRNGLFRQRVDDVWYVFSDFEPTDARMAVPCFDDPRFKIPWQVTLRVPGSMRAFANAPEVRSSPAGRDWRRVEFAPTPPLPTYLLAFAAGPFDVLEGAREPVPMRVIATRGRAQLGAAALAAAAPMLAELERYVGGRTPFAKLDFLAVPTFNGAMENPGLITFHAPILLVEPAGARPTAGWRERHRLMAGVMAHELAHLWFGDLVTMRWWDELWLNEGLATWMSERLMAAVYPADAGLVLDVADKVQGLAMDRIGVPAAVRRAVEKPPDIGDAFSPLTYRKGGAIVSMFEAYLGEQRMRAGLRRYLAENAGGSVTTAKLASALSAAAGSDLGPALSSFLDQPGVPLVDAELECDGDRARVSLKQSPYAALGAEQGTARRWHVPVCVAWQGGAAPACTMLSSEKGTLALPTDRCPTWIHPNPGERGYYIYSLPAAQLRALAAAPLSPREQAGLADDIDALVAAGRVPLDVGLDILWSLARGTDELAALRATQTLDLLARAVVGPRQQQSFAAGLRAALGPRAHQLGLGAREGESSLQAQLREAVVPLVGREANDRALQTEALRRLTRWLDQPNVRSAAPGGDELTLLAQLAPLAGGEPLFDRVLAAAAKREQARAALALGGFRQPALVERALAAVRDGRVGAHALGLLSGLLRDGEIADHALPAALAEYPQLVGRLSEAERARSAVVFASVCRSGARAEVEEVLRRVVAQAGQLPRFARAVLDRIAGCAALREHYGGAAARLLR